MQNIKAILFDFDGTLCHHLPAGGEVFAEYVRSLGFKISAEDHIRAEHWTHFYFANSLEIRADHKMYREEVESFWVNFSRRRLVALGMSAADAIGVAPKVSEYMAEFHKPKSFVPEDAFPLLDFLKSAGYILGVASNRETPYTDKLKEMKLDSYFKFAIAGGDLNSYKPDRAIFDRALHLAGTSAAETMYIGDNYFADVHGALCVGILPVLYDPIALFTDVECAVIRSFSELQGLLK